MNFYSRLLAALGAVGAASAAANVAEAAVAARGPVAPLRGAEAVQDEIVGWQKVGDEKCKITSKYGIQHTSIAFGRAMESRRIDWAPKAAATAELCAESCALETEETGIHYNSFNFWNNPVRTCQYLLRQRMAVRGHREALHLLLPDGQKR